MKITRINLSKFLVYILLLLLMYLASGYVTNTIEYIIISFICVFVVFIFGGFDDLKQPISLFNYFYLFFVLSGVAFSSLLRDYDVVVGKMALLSFLSFNACLSFRYKRKYKSLFVKESRNKVFIGYVSLGFCIFSILASLAYFAKVGTIPALAASTPEQRIAYMSGNGIFLQPMRFGPISALILYLVTSGWNKRLALVLFVISNMFFLGTGFRGPVFQNFLLLVLLVYFIEGKKIDIIKTFKIGSLMLFFVVAIGIFRGDGSII